MTRARWTAWFVVILALASLGIPSPAAQSDQARVAAVRSAVAARQSFVLARDGESFLFNPSAGVSGAPFLRSVYKPFGFSYDSRYFLYLKSRGRFPSFSLYSYDLDTGIDHLLSREPVHFAAWSPTSLTIALVASRPGGTLRLYVHDLTTGGSTLVDEGTLNPEFLEWSPDGGRLLYAVQMPLTADPFHDQVFQHRVNEYVLDRRRSRPIADARVARFKDGKLVRAGGPSGAPRDPAGIEADDMRDLRTAGGHTYLTVLENDRPMVRRLKPDGTQEPIGSGDIYAVTDDGVVISDFTATGVTYKYVDNAAPATVSLAASTDYKLPFAGSAYLTRGGNAYAGGACDGRLCGNPHTQLLAAALDWQQTIEEGQGNGHILAVADGTVADLLNTVTCNSVTTTCLVGWDDYSQPCASNGGTGNYVLIAHADGSYSFYAHLKSGSIRVTIGQPVVQGTYIGDQGHSGSAGSPTNYHSCGDHLHFQRQSTAVVWGQSIATDFSDLPCSVSCLSAYQSNNIERGILSDTFTLTLTPSTVVGGLTSVGNQVDLPAPAPAGGTLVQLATSNASLASVPPTLTVPAGERAATFSISTTGVSAASTVTISASAPSLSSSATATLVVAPVALSQLVLSNGTTAGGTPLTGNEVALTGAAPPGGIDVVLTSSKPAVASVPATVTVPAGGTYALFTINSSQVTVATFVTITATAGGVSKSATLKVVPIALQSLTVQQGSVVGGQPLTGNWVALNGWAPPGGLAVALSSSNPVAITPGTVIVPEGTRNSPTFAISTNPVTANTPVTFSASYAGTTKTDAATILRLVLSALKLSPTSVTGGGTTAANNVSLNGPAPPGGVVVVLSSANPAATPPASVTVPAGALKSPNFSITTAAVAASTAVAISASYGGATKTGTLTVKPPAIASLTLSPASVVGGGTTTGNYLKLNGPAPPGGAVVTLASSNPVASPPATVTVPAGALKSPNFSITTIDVTAQTPVAISATYGGVTKTKTLTVN